MWSFLRPNRWNLLAVVVNLDVCESMPSVIGGWAFVPLGKTLLLADGYGRLRPACKLRQREYAARPAGCAARWLSSGRPELPE